MKTYENNFIESNSSRTLISRNIKQIHSSGIVRYLHETAGMKYANLFKCSISMRILDSNRDRITEWRMNNNKITIIRFIVCMEIK